MYRLRLLGGALVEGPDGPVDGRLARRRPLALMAALAMAGDRGCTRDRLIGLFWSEADKRHARHSLSDVLHSIHRELGQAVTLIAGDVVRLNSAAVETDAMQFERAAERGDVDQAVALYAGPFMDGFHLSGSPAFSEWQDTERRRLAGHYAGALERLARVAEAQRDLGAAVYWWDRRLELDPYFTHAALALAEALTKSGERAAALRVLTRHIDAVRDDLEVEPDPEVLLAIERARGATLHPIPPRDPERSPNTRIPPLGLDDPPRRGTPDAKGTVRHARGDDAVHARQPFPTRSRLAGAAGLIVVAGVAWGWFAWTDRPGTLIGEGAIERGGRVLLADFTNRTGDSTLADAVREGMRALLTDPALVRLISLAAVRDGLERMGRPPETPLDETVARELAEREGARAVVTGEVSRLGSGYQFMVRVVGTADGRELLIERVTAENETEVLAAVDRLGIRVRRRIGESLEDARTRPRLERVSTPSLPALRAYSRAVPILSTPQAIPLLDQAIALDTGFAAAHRLRAVALRHMGRPEEAADAIERAYQHRERLPASERMLVEGTYHGIHLRPESAEAAMLRLLALDPWHPRGLGNLADLRLGQRRFAEAESLAVLALDVGPKYPIPYWNALEAQLAQGRGAAAESLLARAPPAVQDRMQVPVLLALRDWDRAEAAAESRADAFHERVLQRLHGELARRGRTVDTEVAWWPLQLLRYTGDTARALRAVDAWQARVGFDTLPATMRAYWILIPTLAEAGRIQDAQRLLDEWRTLAPRDQRHRSDEDWSLGAIAFAEGRLDSATAAFARWQRAPQVEGVHLQNRGLFEAAAVLDRAGHVDTALALYERALAIRSLGAIRYEATWYPLALRRLGELHASLGHREQAMGYYHRFIDLWKNADPDLQPQVEAVRAATDRVTRALRL